MEKSKEQLEKELDAYEGTELAVTLRLYFDFDSPKFYEFTYSPLKGASLGHIKDKLEDV